MRKRRMIKEDGRYLLLYSFDKNNQTCKKCGNSKPCCAAASVKESKQSV